MATLSLFLMDNDPGGRIKCSISNRTCVAYKIPRTALKESKDIEFLKQAGVYFLFGVDKEENPVVYIGQANVRKNGEGLLYRVQEPHLSIDYWTEAIMFTTSDNSFGPTEISYLENKFCNLALNAKRYIIKNGNDPNPGNITEEKESDLQEFIENAKMIMGVLGHKVLEPFISSHRKIEENEPTLYMNYASAHGIGKRTSDGFVIFKGSTINPTTTKTCHDHIKKAREKYAPLITSDHIITEDILFNSPSAAAGFLSGASVSGNITWKTDIGITLKQLETQK